MPWIAFYLGATSLQSWSTSKALGCVKHFSWPALACLIIIMNNNTKRSPPTVLAGGCGISPGSAGRGSCAFSAHFQRIFSPICVSDQTQREKRRQPCRNNNNEHAYAGTTDRWFYTSKSPTGTHWPRSSWPNLTSVVDERSWWRDADCLVAVTV